jgi:hypothetical protein
VIALGARRQRHLVIALRATMMAGWQAEARIAGITLPAIRAGGQAVIVIKLLACRACGLE